MERFSENILHHKKSGADAYLTVLRILKGEKGNSQIRSRVFLIQPTGTFIVKNSHVGLSTIRGSQRKPFPFIQSFVKCLLELIKCPRPYVTQQRLEG